MSSVAVEVVALALQRKSDRKYLLARRGPHETGAGHWEFPGGKVEKGEDQRQALVREIEEELTVKFRPDDLKYVAGHVFNYPEKSVHLHLWTLKVDQTPAIVLTEHDQIAWCRPEEMTSYQLSPGDIFFVNKLL